MAVGNMAVLNIDDGFVQVFFCQIVDDDFAGIPELGCKSVCKLLKKMKFLLHCFTCLLVSLSVVCL